MGVSVTLIATLAKGDARWNTIPQGWLCRGSVPPRVAPGIQKGGSGVTEETGALSRAFVAAWRCSGCTCMFMLAFALFRACCLLFEILVTV